MGDACISASLRAEGLELAVAVTSELARGAQRAHHLAVTSAIALGRTLTAAVLVELSSKRRHGSTSLQIIGKSRVRQVYADVNQEGHGRGFAGNPDLAFPLLGSELPGGRRSVAMAVLPGTLHVIRAHESGQYTHSTTALVSGEVDADVEHFLEQSDQIPTSLRAEVLLGPRGDVDAAGGVLVQALPGGNLERLGALRARLEGDGLSALLRAEGDPARLLARLAPDAAIVAPPHPVAWRCRCSRARVLTILSAMGPTELAEMVAAAEPTIVTCDLCGTKYELAEAELEDILRANIKAEG